MTRTATAEIATPTYARNRAGFPLVDCGRCGGSGRMPYSFQGGVCFGCSGSGYVFPKSKAGQLGAEWARMLHDATRVDTAARISAETGEIVCDVHPGDEIRDTYDMPAAQAKLVAWRTVERVETGGLNGGLSKSGCHADGTMILRWLGLDVTIHYTDGTSQRGGHLMTRKVSPELLAQRDAMAAEARKLHERTLINRERKAARAAA